MRRLRRQAAAQRRLHHHAEVELAAAPDARPPAVMCSRRPLAFGKAVASHRTPKVAVPSLPLCTALWSSARIAVAGTRNPHLAFSVVHNSRTPQTPMGVRWLA